MFSYSCQAVISLTAISDTAAHITSSTAMESVAYPHGFADD
ncbi:hypothetical protein RIEGSTA812A_PEG_790 [invertebrate metagenome]|uniref:Uncharacterized protein n=1 Tax=invertebrate metagenome TaxID=1711999 RepID=A0A484H5K8_9ZZZZ